MCQMMGRPPISTIGGTFGGGEAQGRTIALKDVSYLRWTDSADTMVVTFGEVAEGTRTGWTKRQYWVRQSNQWKIFFEGTL